MAACYPSSGTAPLQALANSFLGESSFAAAKSALLRPPTRPFHPSHFPRSHSHLQQHPHQPWSGPDQAFHKGPMDPFEHAWTVAATPTQAPMAGYAHHPPPFQQPIRHLQDLDLISSWEQAAHDPSVSATHPFMTQSSSTYLSEALFDSASAAANMSSMTTAELSTSEFESFQYDPASATLLGGPIVNTATGPGQDSPWAKEMAVAQQAQDEEEDEEDEFREEWSNDYFTQAYINSHQTDFKRIEEQQNLKEAQLAEEREQLRRQAGPNGVASMLAPSLAIVSEPARPRLRVPGLDHASDRASVGTQLDVDEFMHFGQQTETPSMQLSHPSESRKPLRVENRFMSLVSDLQLAGQMYYPGASLPTFPELSDLCSVATTTTMTEPCQPTIPTENAWAQEFATERPTSIPANRTAQQYLGAEWNWEKLFGKDPRRTSSKATLAGQTQEQWDLQQKQQLHSGAASSTLSSAVHLEHERLKAVALTRLQALFGHLSLGRPDSLPS